MPISYTMPPWNSWYSFITFDFYSSWLFFISFQLNTMRFIEVFCSPIWHFLDSEAAQRQSMWRASKFVFPSAENERKRFSWLGLSSTETEIVRRALKVCFSQQMRVCILRLQRQSYSIACCWLNQLTHLTLGKARNQKKLKKYLINLFSPLSTWCPRRIRKQGHNIM